jgi:CRISPR-associated protein (TIGR03986 family)
VSIKARLTQLKDGTPGAQIFRGTTALTKKTALNVFCPEMQAALLEFGEVECVAMKDPKPATVRPLPNPEPAIELGLHDRNPYNFAEWAGDAAWIPEWSHDDAKHDKWSANRLSGTITLRLDAATPILVPAASLEDTRSSTAPGKPEGPPLRFWECHDEKGRKRRAIPGSSVKGVLRTLFETWTNARLSMVTNEQYECAIPYRRRSATAWVVSQVNADNSRTVVRCDELRFVSKKNGSWTVRKQEGGRAIEVPWAAPDSWVDVPTGIFNPAETMKWQIAPWRANLLWTPGYNRTDRGGNYGFHKWTHLAVKVGTQSKTIHQDDVVRYQKGLKHESYRNHAERVATISRNPGKPAAGKDFYVDINNEPFAQRSAELKRLDRGDFVFGIPDPDPARPGHLACFGKNVNFLWPSQKSPEKLACGFFPREAGDSTLARADVAEATFGFAGTWRNESHPFRGRIRVGVFWALDDPQPHELQPIAVGPLLSPTGVKLKARPLYLPPQGTNLDSQSYDEASRLRGRKFYWHQRANGDGVAPQHQAKPADEGVFRLQPLGAGTTFEGMIHFENLTLIELGALLATVDPARYLAYGSTANRKFGYKIGKGKPRGLGSVKPRIVKVVVGNRLERAYLGLREEPETEDAALLSRADKAFADWLDARAGGNGRQLPFVKDLGKLLRLPEQPVAKTYVADPKRYGWLPDFESPIGDGQRPQAMRPARDLTPET